MQLKLLLLKAAALIASVIAGGCIQQSELEVDPSPVPVVDDRIAEQPPVMVAIPPEAMQLVAKYLPHNAITLEEAIRIDEDGLKLNVPAKTRFTFAVTDNNAHVNLSEPFPSVEKWGIRLAKLKAFDLHADGSGVAQTSLGAWSFHWDGSAGSPAVAEDLPEVWAYSTAGCLPCVVAKRELAEAKDLPFVVHWKDDRPACVSGAYPAFWWSVEAEQPRESEVAKTRKHNGWGGLKDLTDRWKLSREKPTKSAATQFTPKLRFHSGHNCPACGTTQYNKSSERGPTASTHTHRCGRCGVAWYHNDQHS